MHIPRVIVLALLFALSFDSAPASAQDWTPPTDAERCPSRWGAADERGAANLMKPETVLRAARLIKAGEVIELGYPLFAGMPFYGDRIFSQQLKRTNWPPGSNNRGSNEEVVTTELGQVGTQIDGFSHQSIGNGLYNCFKMDELATRTGFSKLGIEKAGGMFTRGVLLDIAGLRGVEMLGDRYEITAQDLQDALKRQQMTLEPGDAVIVHTGYGKLWGKDDVRYYQTQPGLGVGAAAWLAQQSPMIVGSDTCCVEVNPNPNPKLSSPVHQILLVSNGIYLIESLKLDELVQKGVREFAFIVEPLKLKGATGSTVAPIAVH
ncbi:MAG: cyclase family protein [Acidobacteria bacterium]|nr:cyclase family protein [Acidobacteriota bacterium]